MSKLFIVLSGSYWDFEYWASRHYVPKYLSKMDGNKVVFIEHAVLLSDFYQKTKRKRRLLFPGVRRISPRLEVHSLLPKGPWEKIHPIFDKLGQELIRRQLERIIRKSGCDEACVISFDYKSSYIFKNLNRSVKKVYYVVDDTSEFEHFKAQKEIVFREENETVKNSDLVIATSQPLFDRMKSINPNVHLLSHGVDLEVFLSSQKMNVSKPQDLVPIKRPIVGFVGMISVWVNLELVFKVASLMPDVSFVMIGPLSNPQQKPPSGLNNVYFLGPKDKKVLAPYYGNFDIGIIPFKKNKLVKSVNPLKLLEYLASGLPVISTPMPSLLGLESLDVYVESTPEEFRSRISTLLQTRENQTQIEKRIHFAKKNSWEFKVSQLVALIDESDHQMQFDR